MVDDVLINQTTTEIPEDVLIDSVGCDFGIFLLRKYWNWSSSGHLPKLSPRHWPLNLSKMWERAQICSKRRAASGC
jgi:hypothetical protein